MSKAKDEKKRKNILQAASKIFSKKGYEEAKISEIAREAEVADGTIYLYFQNKEDLLRAILDFNMEQLLPLLRQAFDEHSHPLDQMKTFLEMHLKYIGEHPALCRVFQVEVQNPKSNLPSKNNNQLHEYFALLEQILREAQTQGWIRRDINIEILKLLLFGSLAELSTHALFNQGMALSPEMGAEHIFQIFFEGLKRRDIPASERLINQPHLSMV